MDCPHADRCPGCPGLAQEYADQLVQKRAALCRALSRYGSLAPVLVPPLRGAEPTAGYRSRAKLVVGQAGELGLFERAGHQVVDIPACRILRPGLAHVAAELRRLLPAPFELSGVDLRETDEGVLVTLIVARGTRRLPIQRFAAELRRRASGIAGVAFSERAPDSPQLLGRGHRVLEGPASSVHSLPGLPWHWAAHGAFVQAHSTQAARLYLSVLSAVAERLDGLAGKRVLELYAGSGALALALAAHGARVTAVESYGPAAERISAAAHAQGLEVNARASTAELALAEACTAADRFDAVLVNPPRRGLSPAVRRAIDALRVPVLVYVSCHPETLARDLDHLLSLGWRVAGISGWDMLPHSAAVEAVAVLVPSRAPAPALLHEDDLCIAVAKPPHVEPARLLQRVFELPGAAQAVPLYPLAAGASGVWLLVKRPIAATDRSSILAGSRAEYLGLLKGITRPKGVINRGTRTRYTRQEVLGGHSLARIRPDSVAHAQIERQLASIGHPILGEGRYGDARSNRHFEFRHGLDRAFLHLSRLRLKIDDRELSITAPVPADLSAVLANLAKSGPGSAELD